jgi:hypothetical protein
MAVALLMRLSLLAVKKRKKMWVQLGGKARKKVDIDALPYRETFTPSPRRMMVREPARSVPPRIGC